MGRKKKAYGQDPYFKVSHKIWEDKTFQGLSGAAIKLYIHLCKLRNRLRDKTDLDNPFWRTDLQLINDLGMSRNALKSARKDLYSNSLIMWFSNIETGKRFGPLYIILDDVYQKEADERIDADALEYGFALDAEKWMGVKN